MSDRLSDDSHALCDLALREALQLGYNYIHPEHLLLAMIRQEDSVFTETFGRLGVESSVLRKAVLQVLSRRLRAEREA